MAKKPRKTTATRVRDKRTGWFADKDAAERRPDATVRETVTMPDTGGGVDVDAAQPALVPMSEQELKDAGNLLATLVRELRDMRTEHAGTRSEMKQERTDLSERIDTVAQSIRQQGR